MSRAGSKKNVNSFLQDLLWPFRYGPVWLQIRWIHVAVAFHKLPLRLRLHAKLAWHRFRLAVPRGRVRLRTWRDNNR